MYFLAAIDTNQDKRLSVSELRAFVEVLPDAKVGWFCSGERKQEKQQPARGPTLDDFSAGTRVGVVAGKERDPPSGLWSVLVQFDNGESHAYKEASLAKGKLQPKQKLRKRGESRRWDKRENPLEILDRLSRGPNGEETEVPARDFVHIVEGAKRETGMTIVQMLDHFRRQQYQELFESIRRSPDGDLTRGDVFRLLDTIGGQSVGHEEVRKIFDEVDKDRSGLIDSREFTFLLEKVYAGVPVSTVLYRFKKAHEAGKQRMQSLRSARVVSHESPMPRATAYDRHTVSPVHAAARDAHFVHPAVSAAHTVHAAARAAHTVPPAATAAYAVLPAQHAARLPPVAPPGPPAVAPWGPLGAVTGVGGAAAPPAPPPHPYAEPPPQHYHPPPCPPPTEAAGDGDGD
eukprot:gene33170-43661_t